MDVEEGENCLDNKMLYELNNIHAWEQCITEEKPFLKDVITSSCQHVYQKVCDSPVSSFLQCNPNPTISHDGEYVALVANSTIEIRDKQSTFSLLAEINVDIQAGSNIKWSSNSNHLGVCTKGNEICVYDVHGNTIHTCSNMIIGSQISTFDFLLDEGLNFLVLSDDGSLLSHCTSEKQWFHFEFRDTVLEMMRLSGSGRIITTHLESNGYVIRSWNTCLDKENQYLQLFNRFTHVQKQWQLGGIVKNNKYTFCRLEKSTEKYIVVLNNSNRVISIHYLPSLSIAKMFPYSKVTDLGSHETIVDAGWWSEDIIAMLSSTGKFILISFKTMDIIEAENFQIPSIFIPSPIKSIFVLEQSGEALRSDILKSMKQLVNWSEEESHEVNVNYKLYQLLQTSPSILFYQKIINKEYGEAILLANKFGLDKNEVYKAQWNMSNSHISSINDFLYKITDYGWVLDEIEVFVPSNPEFASLLLEHGLNIIEELKTPPEENEESEKNEAEDDLPQLESSAAPKKENKSLDIDLESKLTFLLNAKVILALYSEILEREIPNELEFDGEMFKVMCSLSLVQIGILFAKRGTWTALDILMTKTKTRPLVEPYWLVMLSYLPETLDPVIFADILPEFVSKPSLSCSVDLNACLSDWFDTEKVSEDGDGEFGDTEVGYWDEEDIVGIDLDISTLSCTKTPDDLEISSALAPLVGPMTPHSVYHWYTSRANQILSESCLFDNAVSLLELGVERLVPLKLHLVVIKLIESAVCRLKFQSVTFDSILSVPFPELLSSLLACCQPEDKIGNIVDVYLPFIQDIEEMVSERVEVKSIVQKYVVKISRDSLLPLLQVLQSHEFNGIIQKEEEVHFTEQCLANCQQQKSWLSIAKEVVELLNNSELQLKLEYSEQVMKHLGVLPPAQLFNSFEDEDLCKDLMQRLLKESFKNKDTDTVEFIKRIVDKKLVVFDFCFKLVFEQCLETGDLDILRVVSRYREEYLEDNYWADLSQKYAELYLRAATDINHTYIDLVRFLLKSSIISPVLSVIQNKVDILEDMRKLGVLLRPGQLDRDNKQELLWICISNSSNNYRQEELLMSLSEKLGVSKCYTYTRIGELAYQNSGTGSWNYCTNICSKAINAGCEEIVPLCVKLLKNPDFPDTNFKETLFHFAIKHVPTSQIDELLDMYHRLPGYVDSKKRKAEEVGIGQEGVTCTKLQRITSYNEVMDLEEKISNEDKLEELYYWLLGRSLSCTNSHIDKISSLDHVINSALLEPSSDIKIISGKISDILQGNILKEMQGNINVPRFTYDKAYRRDVIMNLAEQETCDLAVSLGTKYNMDIWDIHFKHYQHLLLNELQVSEPVSKVLLSDEDRFKERCGRDLYPLLGGTKYSTLVTYYTLLEDSTNLRAVNKIRAAIPGLDYKVFLAAESPQSQLDLLKPLLKSGNVHVIGKIGPNVHSSLTKSAVFYCYAHKYFFNGEGKTVTSHSDRWNKVRDMLQFLDQTAVDRLVTEICLSSDYSIGMELRLQICKSHPDIHKFLENFSVELFEKYKDTYFQSYLKSYENVEVLDVLLIAMWLDRVACVDAAGLLKVREHVLEVEEFADRTIQFLLEGRKVPEVIVLQEEIQNLIQIEERELFETLIKNSHYVVPQKSVIDKLKAVCSATNLREGVLENIIWALEKYLTTEDDTELLVFFKTKPLVNQYWPGTDIQPSCVLSDEFYSALCGPVRELARCGVLFEIVKLWSAVEVREVWVQQLLQTIAKLPSVVIAEHTPEISGLLLAIIQSQTSDNLFEDTILSCSKLFPTPLSHILILSSSYDDLVFDVIPDIVLTDLENKTLLSLVIEKEVYLQLVNTDLYPLIAKELTKEGRTLDFVRDAATKLKDAGNVVEGLSLMAQYTKSNYSTYLSYKSFMSWR